MKYLYWLGVLAVIFLGVWLASSISVHPQTQTKIKFSQVHLPEDFGKRVFETLRSEIKASPVILLGVTPNKIEDMELWRGFLETNQEAGSKYDVLVVEPMLPFVELFESNMRMDIKGDMLRFVEGVRKARSEGLRVAVIVPNIYSSQQLPRNPASRLINEFQLDVLSLSVSKFPMTKEQESHFEPPCIVEEGKDFAGTGPLGCLVQSLARRTYRERVEPGQFSAQLEQVSPKDFLILLNRNPGLH